MEPVIRLSDDEAKELREEMAPGVFPRYTSEEQHIVDTSLKIPADIPEFVRFVLSKYTTAGSFSRVDTLGLASILQCAPPGLATHIHEVYPRAATYAESYLGETLSCSDVGTNMITCDSVDVIFAEYIGQAETNILGESLKFTPGSAELKILSRAIFSGFGHRSINPCWDACHGIYLSTSDVDKKHRRSRYNNAMSAVKARAIRCSHWHVLAALELCGAAWSATDQIVAGGRTPLGLLIRYWRVRTCYRWNTKNKLRAIEETNGNLDKAM